jgi:hypothetical protein
MDKRFQAALETAGAERPVRLITDLGNIDNADIEEAREGIAIVRT